MLDLSAIDRRFLVIGVIILIIAIMLLLWLPGAFSPKAIDTYFGKSVLNPGESTTLFVTVTNVFTDSQTLEVSVGAYSPSITTDSSAQTETNVGAGESRRFEFPISVSESARPGTYSLFVNAAFDEQEVFSKVSFEVRST